MTDCARFAAGRAISRCASKPCGMRSGGAMTSWTRSAQSSLRCLGIFVGGFDLDAAGAVSGLHGSQLEEEVGTLLAQSLIRRSTGDSVRFELLETIRAFSVELLASSNELDMVGARHAGISSSWRSAPIRFSTRSRINGSHRSKLISRMCEPPSLGSWHTTRSDTCGSAGRLAATGTTGATSLRDSMCSNERLHSPRKRGKRSLRAST